VDIPGQIRGEVFVEQIWLGAGLLTDILDLVLVRAAQTSKWLLEH
jgi:hypothetical protein